MEGIRPPVPADNPLEVNQLSVHFGATRVLTGLTFRVVKGSAVAIIGPNLSGGPQAFASATSAKSLILNGTPRALVWTFSARVAVAHKPALDPSSVLTLVGIPLEVAQRPIGAMSGGQF